MNLTPQQEARAAELMLQAARRAASTGDERLWHAELHFGIGQCALSVQYSARVVPDVDVAAARRIAALESSAPTLAFVAPKFLRWLVAEARRSCGAFPCRIQCPFDSPLWDAYDNQRTPTPVDSASTRR